MIKKTGKTLVYGVGRAVRHPRTPIQFHKASNPNETTQQSPIPWWGSIAVIAIGICCWVIGAKLQISGLDEAARVMVYAPIGNLFGMSLQRRGGVK